MRLSPPPLTLQQADLRLTPDDTVAFYDAFLELAHEIRRDEAELSLTLEPGTALIFDNWRVLHGRAAFQGSRKVAGGYVSRAAALGTMRALDNELARATGTSDELTD